MLKQHKKQPSLIEAGDMKNNKAILRDIWNDESGQDLVEYALIASLIVVAAITSIKSYGAALATAYNSLSNSLKNAL